MNDTNFLTDGFGGVEESFKEKEARFSNQVRRVWVKPGASIDLVFLDDRAPSYDEHTIYVNGDYISFTCVGAQNGCPKCLEELAPNAKKTKYRATAFTVIDTSEWKDQRGNVHRNEKKLYVVKEKVALIMKQCFQRFGGFKGKVITVTRTGKDDFSTGSGFALGMQNGQLMQPDWANIPEKDRVPYDYAEILKALPFEQIAALMRQASKSDHNAQSVSKNTQQQGGQSAPQVDPNTLQNVPF